MFLKGLIEILRHKSSSHKCSNLWDKMHIIAGTHNNAIDNFGSEGFMIH